MKKPILAALVAALVVLAGCYNSAETKQVTSGSTSTGVVIEDFKFVPQTISIKKGDAVVWAQKDDVRHTVTSDNGLFDSGLLSKGETWSFTFNEAGTFSYHCTPHPFMTGKVVVG